MLLNLSLLKHNFDDFIGEEEQINSNNCRERFAEVVKGIDRIQRMFFDQSKGLNYFIFNKL